MFEHGFMPIANGQGAWNLEKTLADHISDVAERLLARRQAVGVQVPELQGGKDRLAGCRRGNASDISF